MSIRAETINNFVDDIVKNGVCSSTEEAKQELASKLAEMELDSNIAKGREDYKQGRYEEVTEATNKQLLAEIAQEILPNNV